MDERPHFLQQKFRVTVRAATSEFGRTRRRVFAQPLLAGIVNAHDDERLDAAFLNPLVCGLPDVPVHPGNKGGGAIEKILSVVKIKDGKTPQGLRVVAGRK